MAFVAVSLKVTQYWTHCLRSILCSEQLNSWHLTNAFHRKYQCFAVLKFQFYKCCLRVNDIGTSKRTQEKNFTWDALICYDFFFACSVCAFTLSIWLTGAARAKSELFWTTTNSAPNLYLWLMVLNRKKYFFLFNIFQSKRSHFSLF